MKDLYNNLSVAQSLPAAARTASANGAGVDLQGFEGALVIISTGTITDGTHAISIEESSDNSTFTAVAAGDLLGTAPSIGAANDNVDYKVGYIGSKRYIHVVTTASGTTTGGVYCAVVAKGFGRHRPSA
jgi:hypothetical protein